MSQVKQTVAPAAGLNPTSESPFERARFKAFAEAMARKKRDDVPRKYSRHYFMAAVGFALVTYSYSIWYNYCSPVALATIPSTNPEKVCIRQYVPDTGTYQLRK